MSGVWLASYIVPGWSWLVLAFLLAGPLRQLGLMQLRPQDICRGRSRHWTRVQAKAPDFTALESESGDLVDPLAAGRQAAGARLRLYPAASRAGSAIPG